MDFEDDLRMISNSSEVTDGMSPAFEVLESTRRGADRILETILRLWRLGICGADRACAVSWPEIGLRLWAGFDTFAVKAPASMNRFDDAHNAVAMSQERALVPTRVMSDDLEEGEEGGGGSREKICAPTVRESDGMGDGERGPTYAPYK
jgi:hypothetical protein